MNKIVRAFRERGKGRKICRIAREDDHFAAQFKFEGVALRDRGMEIAQSCHFDIGIRKNRSLREFLRAHELTQVWAPLTRNPRFKTNLFDSQ